MLEKRINETELLHFAANFAIKLSAVVEPACATVFLEGGLGAGKTTFMRGFLRGLNYRGPVKSPTYTFVESYEIAGKTIHHFDLYRISNPEELEFRGVRDYFIKNTLCFIEWPSRGGVYVPEPDIYAHLEGIGDVRSLKIIANSAYGEQLLKGVS